MTPHLQEIKDKMVRMLQENEYPENRLPSEVEMSGKLNISRMSYRAVVKELVQDGFLLVKHGKGTFLVPPLPSISGSIDQLESLGQMIRNGGFNESESQRKVSFKQPDKAIAKTIGLQTGEKAVVIERTRSANNEPISYSINYLPYSLVGHAFEVYDFSGSLFGFLEEHCHLKINCADSEIRVPDEKNPITKDAYSCLKHKSSILLFEQLHYDEENKPILYSFDYLRSDIFRFRIRRRR